MNCPLCGKENPGNAGECQFCKATMTNPWDSSNPVNVRVSRPAIEAFLFSLFALVLAVPYIFTSRIHNSIFGISCLLSFPMSLVALVMGFISIIQIERSGGLITGRKFAVGAVLISVFVCILPIWSIFFPRRRSTAFRMVCGTNLMGFGKAMTLYAYENDVYTIT